MVHYTPPPSRIIKYCPHHATADRIPNPDSIATALGAWGLPCSAVGVDTAPQLLTYHFDLNNVVNRSRVKRYILALSALLRCKAAEVDSTREAHFAIAIQRPERRVVPFCNALLDKDYTENKNPFAACIGYDTNNKSVILDVSKAPHVLIAGATGSGKSVALNTLLNSILFRATPNKIRLLMIDTKRVELSAYEGLPHLYAPIAKDGETAVKLLENAEKLMRQRSCNMEQQGFTDISQTGLPRVFIIIDELGDLILNRKEQAEPHLVNIAQLGRSVGIHLILATQRPTVNVVTGLLKANIPCRIALQTASIRDSVTILDHKGAERLTGRGDAILKTPDKVEETRLQIAYIDRQDINTITDWWRTSGLTTD